MSPIRVLVLTHMYPRKGYPSSGIFIHEQLKALTMVGVEPVVCNLLPWIPKIFSYTKKFNYYNDSAYSIIDGIEVFRPRYLNLPGAWFYTYSGHFCFLHTKKFITNLKRIYNFRIIHAHVISPGGLYGVRLGKYLNIPTIVHIRGSDIHTLPFSSQMALRMTRNVLSSADAVVSVSEDLLRKARNISNIKHSQVIYNGVDNIFFAPEESLRNKLREKFRLGNKSKIILFVGRIEQKKGAFNLIEAFRRVLEYGNDAFLFMIGEPKEGGKLKKYITPYSFKNRIFVLGNISHEEVAEFMKGAYLLVLPSYAEGIPNVVLEAMSCGTPVIATTVGGIPEVISDGVNGFLVEPGNVNKLTELILMVLDDDATRRRVGDKGRSLICNKWTWQENAKRTLELYRKILG